MAQNKKSFIAYSDWKDTFDALPDDKAGLLIKHIFAYVNDENPITKDILVNAVFQNIKNALKRDLEKWDKQYSQRVLAGKKSAEVRKRNATTVNERSISSTDSVNVSVSVNESVNVNFKKSIIDRKAEFKNSLLPFLEEFGKDLLNNFFEYWTEHNEKGKKMRFEYAKNQPFNNTRRLATWAKRQKPFNKEKSSAKKEDAATIVLREMGIKK